MILPLIALALAAPGGQGPPSMLVQMGVRNDPTNGYIDYVKAGEIANTPMAIRYMAAIQNAQWAKGILNRRDNPTIEERQGESKGAPLMPLTADDIAAAERWVKMTPLEIKREARSQLKDMFLLIEAARAKRVWDPRSDITLSTLFPEFSAFRRLGQFLNLVVVDTEFAVGNGAAATQAILDAFRIGDASEHSRTLIGSLIARAIQATSLRSINVHLDRFSLQECRLIDTFISERLRGEDTAVAALASERQAMLRVIDEMFESRDEGLWPPELRAKISSVPASQRTGIIALTKELYNQRADKMQAIFAGDERKWATYLDSQRDPEQEVSGQEAIPNQVADVLVPALDQMLNAVLLRRLQLRLVRPIMAVLIYRWEHDRLPEKLTDAGDAAIMIDPISGAPYQYRRRQPQFEVIGMGTRAMGEVRILQQMAAGASYAPPP